MDGELHGFIHRSINCLMALRSFHGMLRAGRTHNDAARGRDGQLLLAICMSSHTDTWIKRATGRPLLSPALLRPEVRKEENIADFSTGAVFLDNSLLKLPSSLPSQGPQRFSLRLNSRLKAAGSASDLSCYCSVLVILVPLPSLSCSSLPGSAAQPDGALVSGTCSLVPDACTVWAAKRVSPPERLKLHFGIPRFWPFGLFLSSPREQICVAL